MSVLLLLDLGFLEILVILFFVLMFFGAESIPKVARTLGRTIRQVRDVTGDIQREITDSAKKIREEVNVEQQIKKQARDIEDNINETLKDKND